MSRIRTFIAVEITDMIRRRTTELIDRLRVAGSDVKWVDPNNMHLTLKFLGDVPDVEVPQLCAAVGEAALQVEPFDVHFVGAGAFPDLHRPKTLWIGVDQGREPLIQLHNAIDQALSPLGYPVEHRRFHPHLTIGRVRRGDHSLAQVARLLAENAEFDVASCGVAEAVVFASFLDRNGPTYEAMGRLPLGA